jgi:hypothetical protein
MRTTWLAVAVIAGLVGTVAKTAQAAAEDAGTPGHLAACEASLTPGAGLETGTAYVPGADGIVRAVRVRTIVEGDDMTVVFDDRIEFYRITGPEQVELVGSIERPAGETAAVLAGGAGGCGAPVS